MQVIYNFLLATVLILASPLLFVKAISKPKYRGRAGGRLGFGLGNRLSDLSLIRPRIWFHALSVGEVSSAQSLVRAVRVRYPAATIILTTTTRAGEVFARQKLGASVDLFLPFPFDLPPSVSRFIDRLDPDLFILVETDFWPNFMAALRKKAIPALLVNGRISRRSFALYRRLPWLFRPLFASFARLAMQTAVDVQRMAALGVEAVKVGAHGNLKYDAAGPMSPGEISPSRDKYFLPAGTPLWVAGSTHIGEEELILRVYKRLLYLVPDLCLVIAPRQVERGGELLGLAAAQGLAASIRSNGRGAGKEQILILDTLGELAAVYAFCDFAFIGGSLVAQGGHNPLEPAAFGRPVLFGPHMEDFGEVAANLCDCGGGRTVGSEEEVFQAARAWLLDPEWRLVCGRKALELVGQHQGATARHLKLIEQLLESGRRK
jgi:3-deoxy-D-manno-octulosonic-acid transferase